MTDRRKGRITRFHVYDERDRIYSVSVYPPDDDTAEDHVDSALDDDDGDYPPDLNRYVLSDGRNVVRWRGPSWVTKTNGNWTEVKFGFIDNPAEFFECPKDQSGFCTIPNWTNAPFVPRKR